MEPLIYDPDLALGADAAVGAGMNPIITFEQHVLNMIANLA